MKFLPQRRLLLIDDHREVLRALQLCLELEGFEVETAINTHEAARLLSNDHFDLVICDFLLPEMDGIEFRKKMAGYVKLPPFLFCSGMAMEPLEPPFPEGVLGFIAKPYLVSDLVSMMNTIFLPANNERSLSQFPDEKTGKNRLIVSTKTPAEIIP